MKKMLQRIKSCLEFTWRRWYTVSRAPWKLLEEDVAMYQERLGSYLKKTLRCIKSVLEVTWRRCYDVSSASWKLLEEDVTMYQERLGSYLKKMLQRSNVATSLKRRRKNVITPPQKWQQSRPSRGAATANISSHDPTKSYDIIWNHMKSGVDGYNRFNMVGALALIAAEARRKAHLRPRAYGEELDVFIVTSK